MPADTAGQLPPDCRRVREALLEAEIDTSGAVATELRRHISQCLLCSREVQNLNRLIGLAHKALKSEVPEDVCRHLDQALRELRKSG